MSKMYTAEWNTLSGNNKNFLAIFKILKLLIISYFLNQIVNSVLSFITIYQDFLKIISNVLWGFVGVLLPTVMV